MRSHGLGVVGRRAGGNGLGEHRALRVEVRLGVLEQRPARTRRRVWNGAVRLKMSIFNLGQNLASFHYAFEICFTE